jgi:type II secretion system protein D
MIKILQKTGSSGEIEVRLVPLAQGDATSVTNLLSRIYQRVILTPSGSSLVPGRTGAAAAAPATLQAGTIPDGITVALIPVPRFNAIFVAAAKGVIENVLTEIKRLDQPTTKGMQPTAFPLRKAGAARVATQIQNWYAQRYPGEQLAQHQVRLTYDDSSNTVFVQASPADLAEIRGLIDRIDNSVSLSTNDLRIVRLTTALSDQLAQIVIQAISGGVVQPTVGNTGVTIPGVPTAGLGTPGQVTPALGAGPGGARIGLGGAAGTTGVTGTTTKTTSLRFIAQDKRVVESGWLEDIHIISEPLSNSLIISAPEKSMELLLSLVQELDRLPDQLRAKIDILTLKKADALMTANLLAQLFTGTGGTTGALGRPGVTGTLGRTLSLGTGGQTISATPLVDLRLTVDDRTNSIIVAGTEDQVLQIEAILLRLDQTDVDPRVNEVYHLNNAAAADVANALNSFITNTLNVYNTAGLMTAYREIQQQVVVVPEPISNKLLISATPRYFTDLMRLIHELDAQPAQVLIQVLIAEVHLTGSEEFGVEVGLQSPILFMRSAVPGNQTSNSTINPVTAFNFANPSLGLGQNFIGPGIVGFQGLSSGLGVGRANQNSLGGLVISASSDAFSLLIRALKRQGRVEILSRPQIMTLDNQSGFVLVGQYYPYISGTSVTGTGILQNNVLYQNVGVMLSVTPRIGPNGQVIMRVIPEVSAAQPTPVVLGINANGTTTNATVFDTQTVQTTVTAQDGETVVLGGLITKNDAKQENKIPWLGDLPWVGAAFRYRTQTKDKRELLVILTPRIVRSREEGQRLLAEEARRVDWIVGDVTKMHGPGGPAAPCLPPAGNVDGSLPGPLVPPSPVGAQVPPAPQGTVPGPGPAPLPRPDEPGNTVLPQPRPLPPVGQQGQAPAPTLPATPGAPAPAHPALSVVVPAPTLRPNPGARNSSAQP